MAKNQKPYTPEFKQQIVDLNNTGGYSNPQLEREYGRNRSTISGWVKQLAHIRVSEEETITLKEYKALLGDTEAAFRGVKEVYHHANQGTVPDTAERRCGAKKSGIVFRLFCPKY